MTKFKGFSKPNTTPVPDEFFDDLMTKLTRSELLVLLYVIRRTLGFKRGSDDISLSQMTDGIVRLNGERLDNGTGLSKTAVLAAVASLETYGLIRRHAHKSRAHGNEPTTYELRWTDGSTLVNHGVQALSTVVDTQATATAGSSSDGGDLDRPTIFTVYESNIGPLTPILADALRDIEDSYPAGWFEEAVKLACEANVRRLNYVRAILDRWQTQGKDDGRAPDQSDPDVYKQPEVYR